MFFLSDDIIRLIYSFDPTYHDYYKVVVKQIKNYGIKQQLSSNRYNPCLKQCNLKGPYVEIF